MKTYKAGELREDMLVVPVHELESATHSEDGREVPQYFRQPLGIDEEARGRLTLIAREAAISSTHRYSYMPTKPEDAQSWQPHAWVLEAMRRVELEHSRIVAAKDAEIARLNSKIETMRNKNNEYCEQLSALRAQPARQVGGYSLSMSDYLRMANEAFGRVVDHDLLGNPITDYDVLLRGAYGPAVRRLVELAVSCAALAPAAVAVDSSAPLVNALEQVRTMVGNDEYADDVIGFINRSIYNHANLNRRAIPVVLLNELLRHIDKVTYMPFGEPMTPDDGERKKLSDELRALLGKDLE